MLPGVSQSQSNRQQPHYAFGLVARYVSRHGSLISIATPTFASRPGLEEVAEVRARRGSVGFPTDAAIHQKIIEVIGQIEVSPTMQAIRVMRSKRPVSHQWLRNGFTDLGHSRLVGATEDRSLRIYETVNDTRLRKIIGIDCQPRNDW